MFLSFKSIIQISLFLKKIIIIIKLHHEYIIDSVGSRFEIQAQIIRDLDPISPIQ